MNAERGHNNPDALLALYANHLRKGQLLFIFFSSLQLCVHRKTLHCTSVINHPSEGSCHLMIKTILTHAGPLCLEGGGGHR